MKVCAHCGELFPEGKLVCHHCGADADLTLSEAPYSFEHDDPRMHDDDYERFLAEEGLAEEAPDGKKGASGGCLLVLATLGAIPAYLGLLLI